MPVRSSPVRSRDRSVRLMTAADATKNDATKTDTAPPTDLVTLTIDGRELQVPKGTLIIRAAEMIGTQIPRFCDHPLLDPVGACRQRSDEHTSELQFTNAHLGCRLLREKQNSKSHTDT